MELKPTETSDSNVFSNAFNRTSMELKLKFVFQLFCEIVIRLLIAPVWN